MKVLLLSADMFRSSSVRGFSSACLTRADTSTRLRFTPFTRNSSSAENTMHTKLVPNRSRE